MHDFLLGPDSVRYWQAIAAAWMLFSVIECRRPLGRAIAAGAFVLAVLALVL